MSSGERRGGAIFARLPLSETACSVWVRYWGQLSTATFFSLVPGALGLGERFGAGEMDDVKGAFREVGEMDVSGDGLGLDRGGARLAQEIRPVDALGQGPVFQVVDHQAVFGVNEHDAPVLSDDVQSGEAVVVRNAAAVPRFRYPVMILKDVTPLAMASGISAR